MNPMVHQMGLEPIRSPTRPSSVRVCQIPPSRQSDHRRPDRGVGRNVLIIRTRESECQTRARARRGTLWHAGASLLPEFDHQRRSRDVTDEE